MNTNARWSPVTLVLHFIIASAVVIQLATSQLWHYTHVLFIVHEISGAVAFVCLIVFLLCKIFKGSLQNCFPWTYGAGWKQITNDIAWIIKLRLPERNGGGLPGVIQGLGLLLILLMAILGGLWFLGKNEYFGLTSYTHFFGHWHSNFATFVWIYIIGHAAMAVVHWILPKRFKVEL